MADMRIKAGVARHCAPVLPTTISCIVLLHCLEGVAADSSSERFIQSSAIGGLSAFVAETCWCVERKIEGGPTAGGRLESPILRNGGWGEPQLVFRRLQQLGEAA